MRIAVLGGSFDPIHNGHLTAAQAVEAVFATDEVHFVPTFSPPHKREARTSPFHRFAMVALAVAPFERFRVSSIEVDSLEVRYTADTLAQMRASRHDAELLFIVGTDMYNTLDTWRDSSKLLALARFVVVHRPGYEVRPDLADMVTLAAGDHPDLTDPSARVFYLPWIEQPVSSSGLRKASRELHRAWLPPAVCDYIERNNLYEN